jgi:hypothetical protein
VCWRVGRGRRWRKQKCREVGEEGLEEGDEEYRSLGLGRDGLEE